MSKPKARTKWVLESQYLDTKRWQLHGVYGTRRTAEKWMNMSAWTVPVRVRQVTERRPAARRRKGRK